MIGWTSLEIQPISLYKDNKMFVLIGWLFILIGWVTLTAGIRLEKMFLTDISEYSFIVAALLLIAHLIAHYVVMLF